MNYPFNKTFFEKIKKKVYKLREIDPIQAAIKNLENMKPQKMYARRKRNKKYRTREKVYKTYPPRDPYKAWQD